jgi:acetolactate synthase-1/2/3 large subunit
MAETGRNGSAEGTVTGGQLVVEALQGLGVRFVFGVPGGQTLAITDALRDSNPIRFVTARHEGAAACMADAIGRLTMQPGVCIATTGPGVTNMITGIGGALRDSSPLIAIACNNRLGDLDKDDAQNADHIAILRPLVKWAKLVADVRAIPQAMEEAYIRATTGNPGPVLLDFARDVLETPVERKLVGPRRDFANLAEAPRQRPAGDAGRIAEAAAVLAEAEKPTIWLGNGAKISEAGEAALKLARLLDAPVVTTFNGIGAVPTTDANVYGPLSRMGTELSSRVLADTDVVLAVGNSFNAISTARWSLKMPPRIIQVDVDPAMIGRYYADRTLGILGDARAVLADLAGALDGKAREGAAARARGKRLAALAGERGKWRARAAERGAPAAGGIAPAELVTAAREATPADAVAVFDAGNPGVWSYLWEVTRPGTYLKPVGFGNMGFAVPAGIAAKLERPEEPVIVFVGDGSLGMTLGELETVARERLPICIVVMNDRGYGNIRQEQILHFNGRTVGVDFTDVDYAAVARASGLQGVRVDKVEDLAKAVRTAFESGKPWLIDALIDPSANAWTFPLFRRYEAKA